MRQILFALALAGLAACSPNSAYTRSSTTTYPSKPADCQLDVLTVPPQRAFVELGTFDVDHGGGGQITSVSKLLKIVRPRACAEGADAILARKAGEEYVQATALRWTGAAPDAPPPAAPPPDAPPPAAPRP